MRRNTNTHHFFPQSGFPRLRKQEWNMRVVDANKHAAWHYLVANRPPLEAVLFLLKTFTPEKNLDNDPLYQSFIEEVYEYMAQHGTLYSAERPHITVRHCTEPDHDQDLIEAGFKVALDTSAPPMKQSIHYWIREVNTGGANKGVSRNGY